MRSTALLSAAVVLIAATALSVRAQESKPVKAGVDSRFEMFKSLEGEWTGQAEGQHEGAKVVYHVTSGGSAVTETIGPGSSHEMVTIITKDGDNLALTHYCTMGNQPHMKSPGSATGNTVAFKFTGGGNMKSDQETHMHNVTYTFVDKDTLKAEWVLYVNGKASTHEVFTLKRSGQ